MSAWLFDLGNSRLKFAPLREDGTHGEVVALAHDGVAFAPEWLARLPDTIPLACVASVAAPVLCEALVQQLQARQARVVVVATSAECDGVRIAYERPGDLGVDRFLALLAAHARGGARLVVGAGTALTVDLLDAHGRHHGGRIAPAPTLMRQALHARARQLPAGGGEYRVFATATADALVSGCEGAMLGLVEHSLHEAQALLGARPALLLHGGAAEGMLQARYPEAEHVPALVLEGLARWARLRADG